MNLYQDAKNQAFSSFCSGDIANLKILQSYWSRAFWPISQELDFSQVKDLCKNTANIIKFLYRQIQKKLKQNFPINSKNPVFGPFWPIFPIFWGKRFFKKNLALPRTTRHGPITPCWVSEKTNEPIPRKLPDWRTEGRMDRPNSKDPSCHGRGSNKYNCSGRHLKVKDAEKDVGLKLLHYCQHAKNLLNS